LSLLRLFARRALFGLLLVLTVSSGAVLLTRLSPDNVSAELMASGASQETIARERARHGFDRPILEQYAAWLGHAARLDFGQSVMFGRPVGELVRQRAANTALLALAALALATLVGIPLGVVSGSRRSGPLAGVIRAASLLCLSLPPLLTSLVLVFIAARTGWFPIGGMTSIEASDAAWVPWLRDVASHVPLPAIALAIPLAALLERLQSQATGETLHEPFMLAALARGIRPSRLVWRDGFKASVRPVAAIYGLIVGGLLSGSFVVEIVTSWPGLGRLMFDGLRARDLYLVAGCAVAGSVFLAVGSLLSDVALAVADPRLRGEDRP
jgi:peptide/nickel transport system permease protein